MSDPASPSQPLPEGYSLSAAPGDQQPERVHAYLTRSYWSEGIPLDLVRKAMEHSLCVGVFHGGVQVGLARVVTDRATFAYLCDVYVLEEHRGKGLASRLMEAVAAHPDLQGLRRFALITRDAHGLYEKFGFKPLARPAGWMELTRADVYKRP
jgi:GNAT superfamily N-acetyltransferase